MGCFSSKLVQEPRSPSSKETLPLSRPRGGRASMIGSFESLEKTKDQARLVSSEGTRTLPRLSGSPLTIQYAFVSQRGYYPDHLDKANQDAVAAVERLGGRAGMHVFAVFDGHGEYGAECAHFAQDKVPQLLAKDRILETSPQQALHAALVTANSQLHRSPIDDSLSGTTACVALIQGSSLYVANVGDSRAVVAEREGDSLLARDLSSDQTPFRRDECERVTKAGARVLTLDQLEGIKDPSIPCWNLEDDCDGDPPRLWAPNGMYPGTAFTRSIGDSAAEDIGVFAEPEISVTKLTAEHRFVIVASDGVWEFLSSRKAVELVASHDNPYDAAKALVTTAYKLWLQKETRTDDISAVVLFLDGLALKASSSTVSLNAAAQ